MDKSGVLFYNGFIKLNVFIRRATPTEITLKRTLDENLPAVSQAVTLYRTADGMKHIVSIII